MHRGVFSSSFMCSHSYTSTYTHPRLSKGDPSPVSSTVMSKPCKVMRALIYRAHLCPSHLGSEMWVQEGGQETTNHLRKAQDFYSKERVFAIAPKRTSILKKKRKKIIKPPCLGNGEVIYSQHHCVLYRKKSTGELTAETHLLSACPAQNHSEHLESLGFHLYKCVCGQRRERVCVCVCVRACEGLYKARYIL